MEIIKGQIVRSGAGRDKDGFFVVLEKKDGYATICDGKRRSLEKPKKKKIKHLFVTKNEVDESLMTTNRSIRKSLSSFNNKV